MRVSKVFKAMYEMPRRGIFILINEKKKCLYISYSKNLVTSVARNVREMQDKVHIYKPLNRNIRDWRFEIIETLYYEDTILDISCKINSFIEIYKQLGYEVKTHTNIVQLRFRVDIGEDYKVYCKLVTKGHNEYVMGVFNNMEEAEEFIIQYRNMKVLLPVYASNELTRDYFRPKSP